MRKLVYLIVVTLIIGLVLTGCSLLPNVGQVPNTEQKYNENNPNPNLLSFGPGELVAGQNIVVGTVTVSNDADNLYVTYKTDDGWEITETHLAVANSPEEIPQTKKGNPIPGKFEYSSEHDPAVTEYTYTIPLENLGAELCIAAHAEVEKRIDGEIIQEETAWGYGVPFPGKNWATYSKYTVTFKVPPVIDGILSPGEWDDATEIPIAGGMGVVRVLATVDYLYVAFVVDDSTDPRTDTTSPGLSDKFAVNINPTDGGLWGFPYDLLFQISASTGPFSNGDISAGQIDGWETDLRIYDVQQLILPVDLETVTLYGGGTGTCEWKVPLAAMALLPGDIIMIGGATDIENSSYAYPVGLDWSNPYSTFFDIVVY